MELQLLTCDLHAFTNIFDLWFIFEGHNILHPRIPVKKRQKKKLFLALVSGKKKTDPFTDMSHTEEK